jgi:hypothetical protein
MGITVQLNILQTSADIPTVQDNDDLAPFLRQRTFALILNFRICEYTFLYGYRRLLDAFVFRWFTWHFTGFRLTATDNNIGAITIPEPPRPPPPAPPDPYAKCMASKVKGCISQELVCLFQF